MNKQLLKKVSLGLGYLRSVHFTAQSALLPLIDKAMNSNSDRKMTDFVEHLKMARSKVDKLLQEDSNHIANGLYPLSVIFQESPWQHFSRVPRLVNDAIRANRQRQNKETAVFDEAELDLVNEKPEYYQRNFHFQSGGYLSDESAQLYDHQVEILFSGTAQAMRRQIIPKLKEHFDSKDGQGLRFLEVGSGTGSLTRPLALAFPKAQIVCLDISPHYLKYAQSRLSPFKRVSYIEGNAESMDFKDETFDAVFSCYMFHELPKETRKKVIAEKMRVLKKNGFFSIVDSIQKNDDEDLNWALERFPIDFHEPFYKNYTENKLEDMLSEMGHTEVSTDIHFLTKIVHLKKHEQKSRKN